jgi:prophage regulatory protein
VEREDIKLMGAEEIRQRLGYSRQWTYALIQRRTFPAPLATLALGSVWLESDVEAWIAVNRPHLDEPDDEPAEG